MCVRNIHDNDYGEKTTNMLPSTNPPEKSLQNNKLKLTNLIVPIIELDVEK